MSESNPRDLPEETPCQSPETCGDFCIGFCLMTEEPAPPVCDLENPEMCESCM